MSEHNTAAPDSASSRLRPPYASVLDLIGQTPVVELTKFDTGKCRLFIKLESQNPGGSIKDRIALSMIAAAEREGKLRRGGTIVEATAGNTGLGLAQVGIPKGYRIVLVVPDKMSREKIQHLRALGAEVRMTRSDVGKGHAEYYQDMAEKIAAEVPGAFYANQFANPANPLAHETTTGPEIFSQLDGDVDAVVVGVGSGGTLTGLGRYFAKVSPKTEMVLADPVGSVLAPLKAAVRSDRGCAARATCVACVPSMARHYRHPMLLDGVCLLGCAAAQLEHENACHCSRGKRHNPRPQSGLRRRDRRMATAARRHADLDGSNRWGATSKKNVGEGSLAVDGFVGQPQFLSVLTEKQS